MPESSSSSAGAGEVEAGQGGDGGGDEEKGSVRRFVSLIVSKGRRQVQLYGSN